MNNLQMVTDEKASNIVVKKTEAIKALLALTNDSFWRGIFGPFFAFIFPLIFIGILGSMLGYDAILGGALGISTMSISLTSMPQAIFEFKRSSLLKRIGATPVKPYMFLLVTGAFYFVIMFASVIWAIIFALMIFGIPYWDSGKVVVDQVLAANGSVITPEIRALSFSETLSKVNWGGMFWAQIMAILVGASCGMFLVSTSKSTIMIQSIGVTILITSQFLSAQVLPPAMVRNVDALWFSSYALSPYKSTTSMLLESWNGELFSENGSIYTQVLDDAGKIAYLKPNIRVSNIFDVNTPYIYYSNTGATEMEILSTTEKILNFFLPFVWVALFGAISVWKFRWSTRG